MPGVHPKGSHKSRNDTLLKKHWGAEAPQQCEIRWMWQGRRRAHSEADTLPVFTAYFFPFSAVAEAFALPDGSSAVFVGGTCGINGLIR